MNQDLSILRLVLNASVVVQLVMLLLVVVSMASWAAIFRKLTFSAVRRSGVPRSPAAVFSRSNSTSLG